MGAVSKEAKQHRKEYEKIYYKNHKEYINKRQKQNRLKNSELYKKLSKKSKLKCIHNLTEEQYNKMYQEQEGKCLICRRSSDMALSVDHDHKTGKIRGLLCRACNLMLGNAGDNCEILMNAIRYLEVSKL